MAAFTDEILMAYADGALDAEARARVEALVKADPAARARVSMFRATGRVLAAPYEGVLREPVPAHLIQFVMSYGTAREESPAPGPASMSLAPQASPWPSRRARLTGLWAGFRDKLIPQGTGWQLAAASALVIVGAGTGFLLRGDGGLGPNLAALRPGQILDRGVLHQVLETLPSNEERAAGSSQGAAAARAVLTFKAKDGSYCREYEVATAQGQFHGLACRQAGGHWVVEAHVAQGAQATGTLQPAGQAGLLDKAVDGRIEGDAFGEAEEKAAINSGWK